jgi:hypothetical protein
VAIRHPWLAVLGAIAVVFGLPQVAYADSISPYVWFWPGIVSITLIYAFPASLLAAFVERPFITWAGFKQRALVLSLRANFLSTVVGILFIPLGEPLLYALGPLWCVIAFVISCLVEVVYLRRFNRNLLKGHIVVGNTVSSGLLMILPPIAVVVRTKCPLLAQLTEHHEVWLGWSASLVSLALFLASFRFCVRLRVQMEAGIPAGIPGIVPRSLGKGANEQEVS